MGQCTLRFHVTEVMLMPLKLVDILISYTSLLPGAQQSWFCANRVTLAMTSKTIPLWRYVLWQIRCTDVGFAHYNRLNDGSPLSPINDEILLAARERV